MSHEININIKCETNEEVESILNLFSITNGNYLDGIKKVASELKIPVLAAKQTKVEERKKGEFKVGDKVTWTTYSNDFCYKSHKKTGVVVAIMPPHKIYPTDFLPTNCKWADSKYYGSIEGRSTPTYFVDVPGKGVYRPITSQLKLVSEENKPVKVKKPQKVAKKRFKIGGEVTFTTSGGWSCCKRKGKIVAIIPAGKTDYCAYLPSGYKWVNMPHIYTTPKDSKVYLVHVPGRGVYRPTENQLNTC